MSLRFFVSTYAEGRTAPIAIDTIEPDGLSTILRENGEQVAQRYPNVRIMTSDELQELQESVLCSDPVVITEERFIKMLEVLPPMKWNNRGWSETFMLCEFTTGRITGIYCRLGDRYFSFQGVCTMVHDEIVTKCLPTHDALNLAEVEHG